MYPARVRWLLGMSDLKLPTHNSSTREKESKMGLDMYLRAEFMVKKGTEAYEKIDAAITQERRLDFTRYPNEPEGNYIYVSNWAHQRESDPLFEIVTEVTGITPTQDSPSIFIHREKSGDFRVQPTIIYWRKSNQIHSWFVEHVQGGVDECQESPVHPESLMDLLDRCQQVTVDHDKAEALLPTRGGFFFGSTDLDDWYFKDIETTAEEIKRAVGTCPAGTKFVYQSSW